MLKWPENGDVQNVHHLFKGSWRSILGAFLWCSQSNTNFPFFHAEIKGTNWWLSIHPATATLDSLLHLHTIAISNTFTSSSHSKTHENRFGMRRHLFQLVIWSSWSSIIHSCLFYLPWCPSSLLMNPKVQLHVLQQSGSFLYASWLGKKAQIQNLHESHPPQFWNCRWPPWPNLHREKYLGFGTSSLLQHALPLSTLRKTVSGNKYWRELGIPGFLQPLLWNRLRHKWLCLS